MIHVIEKLLTPEIAALLLSIIVLLLAKSKFFTERDFARARRMLDIGMTAAEAAQKTRLKVKEIKTEAEEAGLLSTATGADSPAPASPAPDTNRKKIQRAARALLRGWLR